MKKMNREEFETWRDGVHDPMALTLYKAIVDAGTTPEGIDPRRVLLLLESVMGGVVAMVARPGREREIATAVTEGAIRRAQRISLGLSSSEGSA